MHVLLESRPATTHRRGSTALSVLTHASLIAAAVIATTATKPEPASAPERADLVYFPPALPTTRSTASPSVPTFPDPTFHEPIITDGFRPQLPGQIDFTPTRIDSGVATDIGGSSSVPGRTGLPGDGIFSDHNVDRAVAPRAGNPTPAYPDQLRSSGLQGTVVVRFVVDTAGTVEPTSITILETTHAAFAAAVRTWLPRTGYYPAEFAGRRVRQLVQQRVEFQLR